MDWNVTDAFNKIGSNGAGNIFVPAGTYAVYLNDITGSMMFVAQSSGHYNYKIRVALHHLERGPNFAVRDNA